MARGLAAEKFMPISCAAVHKLGVCMKSKIVPFTIISIFLGSEVFFLTFATSWLVLSAFHVSAWRWPAMAIGFGAALLSAIFVYPMSERAAAAEAASSNHDDEPTLE